MDAGLYEIRPPKRLRIDASTLCQLHCPLCCTTTGKAAPLGKGFLAVRDFERLITANPFVRTVELSNFGEPFLNPDMLPILRCAHEKGVTVTLKTGTNLNTTADELLEGLVRFALRAMRISLDGTTQETYVKYRVGGSLDTVLGNIRKINDYKRKHASPVPKLTWQFIVFGHNEHQIEEAIRMAAELDMDIAFKINGIEDSAFSPVRNWPRVSGQIDRHAGLGTVAELLQKRLNIHTCQQLWFFPQVNWDGRMLGCCRNVQADMGANVFEDDLTRSLNTEKMIHARRMVLGRAEPRPDVACTSCSVYYKMRRTGIFTDESTIRVRMRRERLQVLLVERDAAIRALTDRNAELEAALAHRNETIRMLEEKTARVENPRSPQT